MSLVFTAAVCARGDHGEMTFLAQYEVRGAQASADAIRAAQRQVVAWFIADALRRPSEVLADRAIQRDLRDAARAGVLPAAYFRPAPSAAAHGSGIAAMRGEPVDVVVS